MIYSWLIRINESQIVHVAAYDAQITDNGAIVFYVDSKVVAAFREWVSVERLPSE